MAELKFLSLLKEALSGEEYDQGEIDIEELMKIYKLSQEHHVVPMIYNSIYKNDFLAKNLEPMKATFKSAAFKFIFMQIQKTNRFLELYKKLNKNNIEILVFKGIIFRNMYDNPDDRISADEDIIVRESDYERAKSILLEEGLEFIDKNDECECAFFCKHSGLCIEMSTKLFSEDSKAYGHLNYLFEDIFEKSIYLNINGDDILTMSHQQHLMYIVFHNMKHFLTGGFGIRQVADLGMYIKKYGQLIDWDNFWRELDKLNYEIFALNLIDICKTYLGIGDENVSYTYFGKYNDIESMKNSSKYYINSDSLLNDILDAGVFGASTMDRKHTALMTLDAVEDKKGSNRLKAVFPNVKYLENRYTYLKKYPFLLPVAWIQRIGSYMKKNEDNSSSYINTMNLGKQRIELLKEYKIIK